MNESLKDQLLALGLAPKQPQRKPGARKCKSQEAIKTGSSAKEISLDQAFRIREKEERRQKAIAASDKRERERLRRQTNKKIQTLIAVNAVRDEAADTKRNFLYKGRIRSVLATKEQIRAINDGSLGVVFLRGNYHLMPSAGVEEIRQFAPDHVPDLQGVEHEGEEDHPVPDDLIW